MNAYVDLAALKSALDITGTSDDTRLLQLAERASRLLDAYCHRSFYELAQTKKFDGDGGLELELPDLLSIDASGVKTDDNKDRTFETTWATTDYLLKPSNADPATRLNPQSRPYDRIVVDTDGGTEDVWTQGHQTVQIAGQWGYWRHLLRATETVNETYTATDETLTVASGGTDIEAGHTILIDSEQLYVTAVVTNDLTVIRGVNGTTAASHSTTTVIDIYEYPDPVVEGALEQASVMWKRKSQAFSKPGKAGAQVNDRKGLDDDVRAMVGHLRIIAVGRPS